MNIEKVAVIGAGVMGSAIAAHLANAGLQVQLLDIVPEGAKARNVLAETACKKLLASEPAALMLPEYAKRIVPGNIDDHSQGLAEVDWVIEAVVEDLAVKRALYQKLHAVCRPDAVISSNTSTLPLRMLLRDMPEAFRQRFLITHFFNPPRYMRLLELVQAPESRPELAAMIAEFADRRLGKACVWCKDTPGFIANRIGIYWLQSALREAIDCGVSVEVADALFGPPLGIPKSGVFGLFDLVGIDLIPHILGSMTHALPPDDDFQRIAAMPELLKRMIADGRLGRKAGGGFYRLQKAEGKRVKQAIDLHSGEYRDSQKPQLACLASADLWELLSSPEPASQYAWQVLSHTLNYAASLVPQIAGDIQSVDAAMRFGFNWTHGPFEMLDKIGVGRYVERLRAEGRDIPPLLQSGQPFYQTGHGGLSQRDCQGGYRPVVREAGVLLLSDVKLRQTPVLQNPSASLWDIGDGVVCLEFHSKMNTLDMDIMDLLGQSLSKVREGFAAMVIHNEGENFSAGANLNLLVGAIKAQDWAAVAALIERGQQAFKALKYAPFPVVGAPSGLALGGGCEILLHCDARQAHAEFYVGLVETGVGLVPGWGGCKEYLGRCFHQPHRFGGPIPPLGKAFESLALAKVSKSAPEAKQLLFLSAHDGITMNRQRLLADAKAKALALSPGYQPPTPYEFQLPGKAAKIALELSVKALQALGKATPYDGTVAGQLAWVLSGGDCDITQALSEDQLLALEKQAFVHLVQQPGTQARLEHMLATGKPLRN